MTMDEVLERPIPAMTSEAERRCYYRLAQEAAQHGEVIEFGAWLGASTAWIAAGYRDGGGSGAVQVYDKFESKKGHIRKVREFYNDRGIDLDGIPIGDAYAHFTRNMGPLMAHVEAHRGQIEDVKWGDAPISLIVNDAPKRVPAISAVLTNFRDGIRPGTVMAWQDFCHFPSYEIPACLYRLRDHFDFVEAVTPGSTLVFRVRSIWKLEEVTRKALDLRRWSLGEIARAWTWWMDMVPEEKHALFRCGAAMFLCDIGRPDDAPAVLGQILAGNDRGVVKKWRYLRKTRPDFVMRYRPLFDRFAEYEKAVMAAC